MKDYGISVLTQYQMEVFGTHKVRGATPLEGDAHGGESDLCACKNI